MLQSKAVDNMTADQDRAISRFKQQQQQAAQLAQRTMTVGSPATVAAHLQQPQGERVCSISHQGHSVQRSKSIMTIKDKLGGCGED